MIKQLTPELTDQIIYGMENQQEYFFLDLESGSVTAESAEDPGETVKEKERIPRWTPADGFQLMERFVDSLRNPVYRDRLREALGAGKGVFRNFKNIVKERDEIQHLWFQFKEKEMRSRVRKWFEQVCEARGLAVIGFEGDEPEETDDLVFSDFRVEEVSVRPDDLEVYDRKVLSEALDDTPADFVHLQYLLRRSFSEANAGRMKVLHLVAPDGTAAGIVWGADSLLPGDISGALTTGSGVCFLLQLYIEPEYRGLGMSKILLQAWIEEARKRGMERVSLDLWGGAGSLKRGLSEYGFEAYRESFLLRL